MWFSLLNKEYFLFVNIKSTQETEPLKSISKYFYLFLVPHWIFFLLMHMLIISPLFWGSLCPRWLTGYLGLALVFMWDGAQREKFHFWFSRVFCQYWQSFYLGRGLGTGLSYICHVDN